VVSRLCCEVRGKPFFRNLGRIRKENKLSSSVLRCKGSSRAGSDRRRKKETTDLLQRGEGRARSGELGTGNTFLRQLPAKTRKEDRS